MVSATFFSLERRLIGALLLVALCFGGLQLVSHQHNAELRSASERLQVAASNTERSHQLEDLTQHFRIAAHEHLTKSADEQPTSLDNLTDLAIGIGNQVNHLRMAGMPLYEIENGMMSFEDLHEHISLIAEYDPASATSSVVRDTIDERNMEMTDLAALIAERAEQAEAAQFSVVLLTAKNWSWYVMAAGLASGSLILLMVWDLMRNILPAMRRMNSTIKRLAAGELDIEVGHYSLRELQALAAPLETFRRNALEAKSLAFTDSSTGLPNRRALLECAAHCLAEARTTGAPDLALMLCDIDRFKHINDDFGHAAGDRLVQLVGERMRTIAGAPSIVARLGGDEFAVCARLAPEQKAAQIAGEMVAAMREPFEMGGYTIAITLSIGAVEIAPAHCDAEVAQLLDRADLALYAAKNDGRNRAVLFTPQLEAERELDRMLERDLGRGIFSGELRMVYQPIHAVNDDSREIEALVRWEHPRHGSISPVRFIPAAERSGQMVQLGAWIIERALADLAAWPGISLSLNLSPLQLQQDGFCAFLLGVCRKHAITPDRLILEVTETLSMERNTRALLTLQLLRNAGFRIALDDFGSGYSSLSLLKTFRFDRLKIDRSLINDLASDPTSKAVFEAAVTMALKVGAQVVAEGISEAELVEPVSLTGCTHLQGFHFSRPIEASQVEAYYQALRDAKEVAAITKGATARAR